jgi:hypothetical protein
MEQIQAARILGQTGALLELQEALLDILFDLEM